MLPEGWSLPTELDSDSPHTALAAALPHAGKQDQGETHTMQRPERAKRNL